MYDFERGAKTTGSKFYFNIGETALKEWQLINMMIDYHTKNGYTFVFLFIRYGGITAEQAGILPRFEGDYYKTEEDFILIPTAETPLVGLHSEEIFSEDQLPIKYVAFSPCFRRESGSYGKKDKGLRRVHQFHKIELFVICTPEQSEQIHNKMIDEVCGFLTSINVEWRTVELTKEDRSPVSNKTVDVELKYGDEWLEVSSISNMGENQSKPAQIRYKPKAGGKNIKCHMLNGSGVALPRLMLALENSAMELNNEAVKH